MKKTEQIIRIVLLSIIWAPRLSKEDWRLIKSLSNADLFGFLCKVIGGSALFGLSGAIVFLPIILFQFVYFSNKPYISYYWLLLFLSVIILACCALLGFMIERVNSNAHKALSELRIKKSFPIDEGERHNEEFATNNKDEFPLS